MAALLHISILYLCWMHLDQVGSEEIQRFSVGGCLRGFLRLCLLPCQVLSITFSLKGKCRCSFQYTGSAFLSNICILCNFQMITLSNNNFFTSKGSF